MKIKLFYSASSTISLENSINEWLAQENILKHDIISLITTPSGNGTMITILYER